MIIFLLFTQLAWGDTYRPYQWNDTHIPLNKDLLKIQEKLVLTSESIGPMTQVATGNATISIFPEIAELLHGATREYSAPLSQGDVLRQNCSAHLRLQELSSCALPAKVSPAKNPCSYTFAPEIYVTDHPPAKLAKEYFDNIEGMIAVAGQALSRLEIPASLVGDDFVEKARVIIAKIRHKKLLQQIEEGKKNYAGLLNDSCISGSTEKVLLVKSLGAELDHAKEYLEKIQSEGLAQAKLDLENVKRSGRSRVTLPYPALTDEERTFTTFWLGAIYWRMRGGGIIAKPGTQAIRHYFVYQGFGTLGELNGGFWGRKIGASNTMPLKLRGWGKWFTMGFLNDQNNNPTNDCNQPGGCSEVESLIRMTKRGAYQTQNGAQYLEALGYDKTPYELAGLQMGPVYYFARYELLEKSLHPKAEKPYEGLFYHRGPTSWAEAAYGATLGLGMAKSLLKGYR